MHKEKSSCSFVHFHAKDPTEKMILSAEELMKRESNCVCILIGSFPTLEVCLDEEKGHPEPGDLGSHSVP